MTKTKKIKRSKIKNTEKHRKTQKNTKMRNKVTRRNFKTPNKILIRGGGFLTSIKDQISKLFNTQPISKTDNNSLDRTEPNESYFSEGDFDGDFDDDYIDGDPKTIFLNSLDNSIREIDKLDLSGLTLDDSNKLKKYLKDKLRKLYELSNNDLSKINPGELRLIAGAILSKTFILETFSNCPECPNIAEIKDSEIKKNIIKNLSDIILKPYKVFAYFEMAVKNAQSNEFESE